MIYLGSDHAGWQLKQDVKTILKKLGQKFEDLGDEDPRPDDDYPDYAFKVGEAVAAGEGDLGILLCGSAQGVCIAANKVKGIRAVSASSPEDVAKTRKHNDANILCLSGWHQAPEAIVPIVKTFLATPFSKEARHVRRIEKIAAYENR